MPNEGSPGGGGLMGTLKAKWGPLPVWGWLAAITVILLAYYLYEQHKAATTGTGTTPSNLTPSQVGQPGVVVINQDQPDTDTDPTSPPTVEPKKPNTKASPQQPHKVTRAEAQTALKGHHTVYTRNRGGTYVPVTSLAGVHDTLFVGEQEWDRLAPAKGKGK